MAVKTTDNDHQRVSFGSFKHIMEFLYVTMNKFFVDRNRYSNAQDVTKLGKGFL